VVEQRFCKAKAIGSNPLAGLLSPRPSPSPPSPLLSGLLNMLVAIKVTLGSWAILQFFVRYRGLR